MPLPPPPDTARPARALTCVQYLPAVHLEAGGVTRAVLDWCSTLAGRGHDVRLLTADWADVPADWRQGGGSPVERRAGSGTGLPRTWLLDPLGGLAARLSRRSAAAVAAALRGADVLHLHAPWLPGNRTLAGLAGRAGVPYLVTVHGMLDDWSMSQRAAKKRLYMRLFGRAFLARAGAVHCTAADELRQARSWFEAARTVVLPYLFDVGPFRQPPDPEPARRMFPAAARPEPKVLFLSRVHEKKGVDVLIEASALLRARGVGHVVLVAGPGDAGYVAGLQRLARDRGVADAVAFLGPVVGPEKLSLYAAADAFVLPTHQENFGLVLPEAMACGTPVVTTRGVDIWREVESAGGVVTDRTPAAVADAIAGLLADPAAAAERGRRGRAWVFDFLDPDRLAGEYERLYASLSPRQ